MARSLLVPLPPPSLPPPLVWYCNLGRLDLIPLLQELAGGSKALESRLDELSRQSLLAREMVEQEALRWERQQSIDRRGGGSGRGLAGRTEPAMYPRPVTKHAGLVVVAAVLLWLLSKCLYMGASR